MTQIMTSEEFTIKVECYGSMVPSCVVLPLIVVRDICLRGI